MSKKHKNNESDTIRTDFHGVNKIKIGDIIIVLVITILCMTCILPFLHIMAKSLSSDTAVLSKSVYLIPKGFNIKAYKSIFEDGQLVHSMLYSIEVTAIFTLLGMFLTICAAYPLSRKSLKGRNALAIILLFSMYFSAGLIPEYLLMRDLHLIDKMWVLILPLAFSPYNTLIMKSFFQANIPESLVESARIDGATNIKILIRIVLPLSKPILATLSLFYAVGRWNAYADAKYYITTKALQPIQLLLNNMVLSSGADSISILEKAEAVSTPEVLQAATVMFATIPILCIYPFAQKYFVKGVTIGAVKG